MTSARRMVARARLAAAALSSLPAIAWSHAFDDRYDLPAPLSYFVAGAAAVVALSFVVAALFVRSALPPAATQRRVVSLGPLLPVVRVTCRVAALMLFALTLVSGWFGTGDSMMNLAPTMIWIIWWVGLSLAVACIGNLARASRGAARVRCAAQGSDRLRSAHRIDGDLYRRQSLDHRRADGKVRYAITASGRARLHRWPADVVPIYFTGVVIGLPFSTM